MTFRGEEEVCRLLSSCYELMRSAHPSNTKSMYRKCNNKMMSQSHVPFFELENEFKIRCVKNEW